MLGLAISDETKETRQRAVDALHDASIEVVHAGPRPDTRELTRDPGGIALSSGFGVLSAGLAWRAMVLGGWWWAASIPLAVVVVLCLAGGVAGAQAVGRAVEAGGETGNPAVL